MEYAHPRSGVHAWHWEPKDVRPEEGEYWSSRGYDLSGFVKTKAAGERILAMVHEVLGTVRLIQTIDLVNQLGSSEFDLEKLDKLSREANRVITKEILNSVYMAKVINSKIRVACLTDMKDGDVAEVINWLGDGMDPGTVVQRYGDALIVARRGECYPTIFTASELCNCKVMILPPGSTIML